MGHAKRYTAGDLLEAGAIERTLAGDPAGLLAALEGFAERIASQTPLGPDASYDDPEDWQLEAVALAHGFRAYAGWLRAHGTTPAE